MITETSIVYYKEDKTKHPYMVHEVVSKNIVILGLKDYPDIEQDYGTHIDELEAFEGAYEVYNAHIIYNLINS